MMTSPKANVRVVLGQPALMSKLLSLDQSSRITGYAIFDNGKLIHYGKIVTAQEDIGERLLIIRTQILQLINEYHIDQMVFEDIQLQGNVSNNVQTFKVLAEVFGIVQELATELQLPHKAIHSSSWKSTLNIKGRTRPEQKRNAQITVEKAFNIKPSQDECDAICIGLHHLIHPEETNGLSDVFDWSE